MFVSIDSVVIDDQQHCYQDLLSITKNEWMFIEIISDLSH